MRLSRVLVSFNATRERENLRANRLTDNMFITYKHLKHLNLNQTNKIKDLRA